MQVVYRFHSTSTTGL